MEKIILQTKQLVKTYKADSPSPVYALKGIDIQLKKGEFVALMGRSGSGKSTFLHQIALLDRPTSGYIEIDSVDVAKLSEKQRSEFRLKMLGYVFQDYALIPELNLYENVALPMMALGEKKKEYNGDVLEIIERVGLHGREGNLPSELSGGEQQRVSIARAIVNKPNILFADEPTANLDFEAATVVLNLMRELVDKYGQTIIMVTHEPDDKKYVDRAVWLKDGKLQSSQ
ncbi:MAG TPA: ABC transporter ATP-binding protein [Candidatus Pacebacteria bacterium]|nr:ABC transporter ATP-binding protein [Candidatus Paceibacterota bacterium]